MSTVQSVSSVGTGSPSGSSSTGATNTLDYNDFLQLLIAQLQNQDPTAPTDSTQFVSQLATFSQVEQSVNTNSKLDSLLTSSSLSLADAVIGKTITAADGSASGVVTSVTITSDGPVATLADGSTVTLGSGVEISQ